MAGILGNVAGGFGMPKTFVLIDENNNEITGVVTEDIVVFTAKAADIKAGKTAAIEEGIVVGTHECS